MLLYKFSVECGKDFLEELISYETSHKSRYGNDGGVTDINNDFHDMYTIDKAHYIAIAELQDNKLEMVVSYDPKKCGLDDCAKAIKSKIPECRIANVEEITLEEYARELAKANQFSWLKRSDDYVLRELGLKIRSEGYSLFEGPLYAVEEKIFNANKLTKKNTLSQLDDILASKSFYEEIERIYSSKNMKEFRGHPVHYLITAGDKGAADDIISILIPSLIKNKRLLGGRVADIVKLSPKSYREENFRNVFSSSQGSTVIVNLAIESSIGSHATSYHEVLDFIGKMISDYGNNTLFIFVDVSGSRNVSDDAMAAILGNADMIRIDEGYGDIKAATEYLKRLAEKSNYGNYDISELTANLPKDKAEYTVTDVFNAYNRWYGTGLKTHVYRAYKDQDLVKLEVKNKTNKPYEELQKLIGLSDVKRVTDEILSAAKLNKIRSSMGMDSNQTSLHMLFAGNPGTAKTTVARLLAQILKDEEVLKNGQLVECGRQDLVGKYVGWTAKIVEEKFRAARGGILFIDEAYSLVEDHNSYGTEAINTIVQMMENYRDEVIVIFAGYPAKMQEFLNQNEGLRSRIAFHMNFPDYDAEELGRITKLMLENKGFKFDSDQAFDKCLTICSMACREQDFGNGRFVRNLVEHAIMRQANRLVKSCKDGVLTKDDVSTLTADDFEVVSMKKERKTFGFAG